jgi:hypothetical protein
MAFEPLKGSYYYLVAKHSGKVLEAKDKSSARGATLQQNDALPFDESYHQQFEFVNCGERIYMLRVRHSKQVVDIKNSSKENGADVILWDQHETDNQRFHITDAGDGGIFIEVAYPEKLMKAGYTGKVLEIYGEEKGNGKPVKQHARHFNTSNPHQRFQAVMADEKFTPDQLPGFTSPSQIVRDATLGLVGVIPTGGGVIKGIAGVLWKDAGPSMIWNQVMRYIEGYVDYRLTEERIETLKNTIDGARENLQSYLTLKPSDEKAKKLVSIITALTMADQKFFTLKSAEYTLSYLITLGTIKLTLLKEAALNYAELSGQKTDENAGAHLTELRNAIEKYTKAAQTFRDAVLTSRLDKIGFNVTQQNAHHTYPRFTQYVTLRDGFDGRELQRVSENVDRRVATGKMLLEARTAQIKAQLGARLDHILAPALLWAYLDPKYTEKPPEHTFTVSVGPWGHPYGTISMADGKQLTRIELWGDADQLHAIRVTNGSGDSTFMGKESSLHADLALMTNERIISVYGSAYHYIHSLFIETNFGRRIGMGVFEKAYRFQADLPAEVNATLTEIIASTDRNVISSLEFKWEYRKRGAFNPATGNLNTEPAQ